MAKDLRAQFAQPPNPAQVVPPLTYEETLGALWDKIIVPENEVPRSLSGSDRQKFVNNVKENFVRALYFSAHPEHTRAIVNQARSGQYTAYITLQKQVGHLRAGYKGRAEGMAVPNASYHSLDMLNPDGTFKRGIDPLHPDLLGADEHFNRRIVHETGHVIFGYVAVNARADSDADQNVRPDLAHDIAHGREAALHAVAQRFLGA